MSCGRSGSGPAGAPSAAEALDVQGKVLPPMMVPSEPQASEEPAGIRASALKSKAETSTHKWS